MGDPQWKSETGRYLDRLTHVVDELSVPADLVNEMPSAPFESAPSEASRLSWLLCAASLEALISAREIAGGVVLEWRTGLILNAAILIRSLFELWSFSHYGRAELLSAPPSDSRLERLWFGSSSNVKLPWGGKSDAVPIGIRQYVERLKSDFSNAGEDYSFLCDAAHPTLLQHKYLRMAGLNEGNWSNEGFRTHAHEILERLVKIAEHASSGIRGDVITVLTESLPNLRLIEGRRHLR